MKALQHSDLKRKIKSFWHKKQKEIITFLFAVFIILIPVYNNLTERYIDNSLKQAGITYLIIRSINATVSVIKHSAIDFNAGIGGSIAIGEALDPIDDATERFSDLLTLGIWSLGAEKIIYELTKFKIFSIIILILALSSLFISNKTVYKILVVLLFIKIFMPFSAIITDYADRYYFSPNIKKINASLTPAQKLDLKIHVKTNGTLFEKIKNSFSDTASYIDKIKAVTKYYLTNSAKIINDLLQLGFLYLAKFLLNILILPLLLFYFVRLLIED